MDKSSELDCYLYFMWNRWNAWENDRVFGEKASVPYFDEQQNDFVIGSNKNPLNHFWNKWTHLLNKYGIGAPAAFYSELSSDNRRKLVDAAVNYYNS